MKVTLTNATLQFAKVGTKTYVKFPLGSTGYTLPFIPNAAPYTSTFMGTWEFEYDSSDSIRDSSLPTPNTFVEYVGGRPTGR